MTKLIHQVFRAVMAIWPTRGIFLGSHGKDDQDAGYAAAAGRALLADRYDKVNSHRRLIRAMGRMKFAGKVHSSLSNMDGCNCFL